MIDAGGNIRLLQRLIRDVRPAFPHMEKLVNHRLQPELDAIVIVPIQRRFRAQTLRGQFTGGREQMGVKISRIAAGKITRCMNGEINGEPVPVGQLL